MELLFGLTKRDSDDESTFCRSERASCIDDKHQEDTPYSCGSHIKQQGDDCQCNGSDASLRRGYTQLCAFHPHCNVTLSCRKSRHTLCSHCHGGAGRVRTAASEELWVVGGLAL